MTNNLPHNREAEEAVVGAVLINPDIFTQIDLAPDDFYIHRLRWVWEAFTRLHESKMPLDIVTVADALNALGRLEEAGGAAFLTALLTQVPSSLNAEGYARIVREDSVRRKLLTAANELARLAYDQSKDLETVLSEAEQAVRRASQHAVENDAPNLGEVILSLYDRAAERNNRAANGEQPPTRLISSGLADFDRLLKGGFRPGRLYIPAGRPGQGKTSLMLTIANNAALRQQKRVAIFSLEMGNEEVAGRLLAMQTGLDANMLLEDTLPADAWQPFTEALGNPANGLIVLNDTPALTPVSLRSKAHRIKSVYGMDLLILDYIQLMRSGIRTQNREQEVAYISRELKLLARELDVPVLAAAQLNRAVEQRADREPQLSDLRESGSLENDADVVAFVFLPAPDALTTSVKVAKHRNGPVGKIDLFFNRKLTRFENLMK
ncbi:MAG: replicative DNA helicase [Chloroflexota bacterium]|jgi:replicative DNA helicase